ncbi:hypothetical protein MY1884_000331 [Beauveria asiatica]
MKHFADINATFASSPGDEVSYAMIFKELPKSNSIDSSWYFIMLSDIGSPSLWSLGMSKFSADEPRFKLPTYTWEDPTDPNCKRLSGTAVVSCQAEATVVFGHRYNHTLRIDQKALEAYVLDLETDQNTRTCATPPHPVMGARHHAARDTRPHTKKY